MTELRAKNAFTNAYVLIELSTKMSGPLDYRISYKRNLPHIQPSGTTFFVTFRLHGSLPLAKLEELVQEFEARKEAINQSLDLSGANQKLQLEAKRYFGRFDAALDLADFGPVWLQDPSIAQIVAEAMHGRSGVDYDLLTYCIMPNHVHLVLTPLPATENTVHSLPKIMHDLKGYSAWQANAHLGRKGKFWQAESYDHIVRDRAELTRIVKYVLQNPVKARLVDEWQEWPWSYWGDDA